MMALLSMGLAGVTASAGPAAAANAPLSNNNMTATPVANEQLIAGTLFWNSVSDVQFPTVSLNSFDQTVTTFNDLDVTDATGSGDGWSISLATTQFADGNGHTLADGSTTLTSVGQASCDQGSSCTLSSLDTSYPIMVPASPTMPPADMIYAASPGTGMGAMNFDSYYSLAVPADAAAGTYSATWMYTLSQAQGTVTGETQLATPAAPTGVLAAESDGQVSVSWTAAPSTSSAPVAGYYVYRDGSQVANVPVSGSSSSDPSWVDTDAVVGATYTYSVAAYNGTGSTLQSVSAQDVAKPLTVLGVPAAPVGITTKAGEGQIAVSWGGVADATSYTLYQDGTTDEVYTGPALSYTVTGLTGSTSYYFYVTATSPGGTSSFSLPSYETLVCGAPSPGVATCRAVELGTPARYWTPGPDWAGSHSSNGGSTGSTIGAYVPAPPSAGFYPVDLLDAYSLSGMAASMTPGRAAPTIAVVDAYNDPHAAGDLRAYRASMSGALDPNTGLADSTIPPLCGGTVTTGCVTFTKVDQTGGTSYPANNTGWAEEISLDLDTVSAVCPGCNIVLVEANSDSIQDLAAAVTEAKTFDPVAISNSYGSTEFNSEAEYNSVYTASPGTAITAASGDDGYGTEFPAAAPGLTAVGGATLSYSGTGASLAWGTQDAWAESGSGCSSYEPMPSWQDDQGVYSLSADCSGRQIADISADANPVTGVAVYDSYGAGGWTVFGGTSVSAQIIAAAYGLAAGAGTGTVQTEPQTLYTDAADSGTTGPTPGLVPISAGSSSSCGSYLCDATRSLPSGYNGPTGLGTLSGVSALLATPTVPDTLSFEPANEGITAGQTAGPVILGLAQPAPGGGLAATLSTNSSGGGFSLSTTGPFTPTLGLTVPSGSTATPPFYYRDTAAGVNTITASAAGATPGVLLATVVAGPLANITITPATVVLAAGSTQVFTATGTDSYGNAVSVYPAWSTTVPGGTTSPADGSSTNLTAGNSGGTGQIAATQAGISGAAAVTVQLQMQAPAAPSDVTAQETEGQVVISWVPATAGTNNPVVGYNVYSDGDLVGSAGTTATSWTDPTPALGAQTYSVDAYNAVGPSPQVAAPPLDVVVTNAPAELAAAPSNQQVVLSWAAVGGAYSYTLYQDGAAVYTGDSTTYTAAGLADNTQYNYYVTADNSQGGTSAGSSVVNATPEAAPVAPTGVVGSLDGNGVATVTWAAPAGTFAPQLPLTYTVYDSPVGGTSTVAASGVVGTNTTITGLDPTQVYVFTVSATDVYGQASPTSAGSAPAGAPPGPTNLVATPTSGQIALSWHSVTNATSYTVYSSPSNTTVASGIASTSYTVTGLTNNTAYSYYVKAIVSGSPTGASSTVTATPEAVPGAPTGLSANAGSGQVTLSWTAPSGTYSPQLPLTYNVYQNGTAVQTGDTNTTATITGLTAGTQYSFTVVAVDSYNQVSTPAAVLATPIGPPAAPTGVYASESAGQVTLSWTAVTPTSGSPVTGYYIYRTDQGSTPIATVTGASTSSYLDSTAQTNNTYTYSVESFNTIGSSAPAVAPAITVVPAPLAPAGLVATPTSGEVTVSWQAATYATSYTLYSGASSIWTGTATSYLATGLTNNTAYTYYVTAAGLGGTSTDSATVAATPEPRPQAPTGMTATAGASQVSLSWTAPSVQPAQVPLTYTLYQGGVIAQTGISSTSTTVTGLTNGTSYSFTVTAIDAYGQSSDQSAPAVAIPIGAPGAVSNITLVETDGQVLISWTAATPTAAGPVTGYYVYRAGSQIGTTSGTSFTDTQVTPGNYVYSVAAYNSVATAQPVYAMNFPVVPAPAAPTGLAVAPLSGQVTVSWAADTNTTSYTVYADGIVAQTGITGLTYTVTGLANGVQHSFYVVATGPGGTSSSSSTVTSTPEANPAAPTSVTAAVGNTQITLSWTAPSGVPAADPVMSYTLCQDGVPIQGGITATSATAVDLVNGTSYSFTVVAVDSYGQSSAQSAPAVAIPIGVPAAPTGVSAAESNGQVNISWAAAASTVAAPVTGYDIYRDSTLIGTTSGTSYADPASPVGMQTYSVTACNTVAVSLPGYAQPLQVVPAPASPSGLTATPADGQITVRWAADTNATSYTVYLDGTVAQTGIAGLTYTVTGLADGTQYNLYMTATGPGGTSGSSGTVTATPVPVPAAPTDLTAVAGNTRVSLSWAAPAGQPAQLPLTYTLYQDGVVAETGISTLTATAAPLIDGTSYSFAVVAVDSYGQSSAQSAPVTAVPITVPDTPAGVSATESDGQVNISWDTVVSTAAAPVLGYNIYRDGAPIGTASGTSFTDTQVTPGTYTYTVMAYNTAFTSLPGYAQPLVVVPAPAAPAGITAAPADGQITVRWAAGTNATSYTLYSGGGTQIQAGITGLSYTITGLADTTQYSYYVVATGPGGTSGSSATVSGTPEAAPAAPSAPVAVIGNTRVSLSWAAPPAQGPQEPLTYTVYQDGVAVQYGLTSTSAIISGLTNGTSYSFTVTATDSYGQTSAQSSQAEVAPVGTPANPTGVNAAESDGQVTVTWVAAVGTAAAPVTGYYIYNNGTQVATVPGASSTSWADNTGTLSAGLSYTYSVAAYNTVDLSAQVAAPTLTFVLTPVTPAGLTATPANGQVTLSWTASPNATSYTLYQGPTEISGGPTTSRLVTGLTDNTAYTFSVTATGPGGTSSPAQVTATPEAPPGAPTQLTGVAGNSSVLLSWTAPNTQPPQQPLTYKIYANDDGYGFVPAGSVVGTASDTVTGLTNGDSYIFYVTATDSYGQTSNLSTVSGTIIPIGVPGSPSEVNATESAGQVTVSWAVPASSVAAPVAGYYVYSNGTQVAQIASASASSWLDTVDTLNPGSSYTYSVAAYNIVTSSAQISAPTLIYAGPPAAAPAAPTAAPASGQVALAWATVTGATTYVLYQGSLQIYSGPANAYTATGLTNNTTYSFSVVAVGPGGTSASSAVTTATPEAVPAAPSGLTAITGNTQVSLSWTAPSTQPPQQPVVYTVYQGGVLIQSEITSTSFTVTGLPNGTSYSFTVAATDAYGQMSAQSGTASATPIGAPAAPGTASTTESNGQLTVSWAAAASSAAAPVTGYYVYNNSGTQVAQVTGGSTSSWLDTVDTFSAGSSYTYSVASYNAITTSAQTAAAPVTYVGPPAAPTGLAAAPANGQATLSWAASVNATSYAVYRSGGSQVWSGSATSANVTGLTNGTTYYFYVVATGPGGSSGDSSTVSALPEPVPSAPWGMGATIGNTQVSLSWTAPSGVPAADPIMSYTLYQDGVSIQSGITGTSYTVTGLVNGTNYSFTATATDSYGQTSAQSSPAATATPIGAPAAPSNVTAVQSAGPVVISWTAAVPTAAGPVTGYYIYRAGTQIGTTSGTSYNDSTAAPGTYTYSVATYNAVATSAQVPAPSVTVQSAPSAPTGLGATPSSGQVVLSWTATTGANSYSVYANNTLAVSGLTSPSYTDTNVTNGNGYNFYVIAIGTGGSSPGSSVVTAYPEAVPAAPTNITAAAASGTSATVSWTAPPTATPQQPITYTVYECASGCGTYSAVPSANGGVTTSTSSTITGLSSGTSYTFEVTATDAYGQTSPFSAANSPLTMETAPAAPTNASANETSGTVTVSWTPAQPTTSAPITGYYVYRSDVGTSPVATVAGATTASWVDNTGSLVANSSYTYSVAAYNSVGTSAHAAAPSMTYIGPPAAPTVTATPGDSQIVLSWTAVTNATGYTVYETSPGSHSWATSSAGYTATGLADGTSYSFYVTANGIGGTSGSSNTVTTTPVATTTLSVSAPTSGTAGTAIAASSVAAVLAGGSSPTGIISFSVYGPSATAPSSCQTTTGGSWAAVGTGTSVSGNNAYNPSASFTPAAGVYWWYAAYGGDTGDSPATSTCGSGMPQTAVTGTANFSYTGAVQTWTVPAGVTSITVGVTGGGGGTDGVAGGTGAAVAATVAVQPGDTLNIYVAEQGQTNYLGGWGYHEGGASQLLSGYSESGGGGGSSAILDGSTPMIEAGGGGGYAWCTQSNGVPGGEGDSGGASTPTGGTGGTGSFDNTNEGGWFYAYGGSGASQSGAGAGGTYSAYGNAAAKGVNGSAGGTATSVNGGNGAVASISTQYSLKGAISGAGGGGYNGGGSGAAIVIPVYGDGAAGGGGAGASWVTSSATNVSWSAQATAGNGSVSITYTP
jgi:titin